MMQETWSDNESNAEIFNVIQMRDIVELYCFAALLKAIELTWIQMSKKYDLDGSDMSFYSAYGYS